ncbi:DUF3871 family protein [Winogradskyella vincentii]|uniref:DUF3871 family protein n=1 Tax=Winogradskyella vincentii TaxID=2877122 RepID=A0ABS7XZ74_9FLAO|nr:DUF3871 family protein [Winogradskyella vincentii]MCA0151727.1 DUF3871 family protein [Winogradskyella vincentii]
MELIQINNTIDNQVISKDDVTISQGNFIEANTEMVSLSHLKRECIIPVYADNESTISHAQFIEATKEVVQSNFQGERVYEPNIRVSHIIKGRVPSAIGKPVKQLKPEEKTIYYQRAAFMIEVPSLKENVNNNSLSLTIGGVRALNQENLYSKRNLEKFKVFIGFKNLVCTNLCISTDGLNADIRVSSVEELKDKIAELIQSFDKDRFLGNMERMSKFKLDELQFAHTIGKMRMYQHLNKLERDGKFALGMNDNQIGTVVKNYYQDDNFSRSESRDINLWNFYNLMTEANKSSYIDSNLERNANAFEFVSGLANSMQNQTQNWFLN